MSEAQVIEFGYRQSLSIANGRSWSEQVLVSVSLFSEAFSSGWYAQTFGRDTKTFMVLLAIVMHARPLNGKDLEMMIATGMATPEDEGRLFARVTDMGLAEELGFHRDTVASCALKLHKMELITIAEIPKWFEYRDSHGQFAGSKVYLVAGDLQGKLTKHVENRAEKFRTVEPEDSADYENRAEKFRTVEDENPVHRAENAGMDAEKFRTNRLLLNTVVVVNGAGAAAPDAIWVYFAHAVQKPDHTPGEKERQALAKLRQDGFSDDQIMAGIDAALARGPVRHFTHCAAIARDVARQTGTLTPEARPLTRQPESAQPEARKPETRTPEQSPEQAPPAIAVETELLPAVNVIRSAGAEVTEATLARLRLMAQRADPPAREAGSSGAAWVADTLASALGRAQPQNLLGYADKILENWSANGRPTPAAAPKQDEVLAPEIQVFFEATGRKPLSDQRELVIRAVQEYDLNADYLRAYWQEWVKRDKKRSDLTWLDWAIRGEIPDMTRNGNSQPAATGVDKLMQALFSAAEKGA